MKAMKYPVLKVDPDAVKGNTRVMCEFCKQRGIDIAGVVKFSDGDIYADPYTDAL